MKKVFSHNNRQSIFYAILKDNKLLLDGSGLPVFYKKRIAQELMHSWTGRNAEGKGMQVVKIKIILG